MQCLKLLSILAAIGLDSDIDAIEKTLAAGLLDSSGSVQEDRSSEKFDPLPLSSESWEQVHFLCIV